MKKLKTVQARFAALDKEWEESQENVSTKMKKLRHAIRESTGDEPETDPKMKVFRIRK